MKRVIKIFVFASVLLLLTACGTSEEETVWQETMDAMKRANTMEVVRTVTEGDTIVDEGNERFDYENKRYAIEWAKRDGALTEERYMWESEGGLRVYDAYLDEMSDDVTYDALERSLRKAANERKDVLGTFQSYDAQFSDRLTYESDGNEFVVTYEPEREEARSFLLKRFSETEEGKRAKVTDVQTLRVRFVIDAQARTVQSYDVHSTFDYVDAAGEKKAYDVVEQYDWLSFNEPINFERMLEWPTFEELKRSKWVTEDAHISFGRSALRELKTYSVRYVNGLIPAFFGDLEGARHQSNNYWSEERAMEAQQAFEAHLLEPYRASLEEALFGEDSLQKVYDSFLTAVRNIEYEVKDAYVLSDDLVLVQVVLRQLNDSIIQEEALVATERAFVEAINAGHPLTEEQLARVRMKALTEGYERATYTEPVTTYVPLYILGTRAFVFDEDEVFRAFLR